MITYTIEPSLGSVSSGYELYAGYDDGPALYSTGGFVFDVLGFANAGTVPDFCHVEIEGPWTAKFDFANSKVIVYEIDTANGQLKELAAMTPLNMYKVHFFAGKVN